MGVQFDIYKLKDKYKLSDTETQILEYLLNHHKEVLSMAVRDVAAANYTSAATIIKLAKKMGYTGYIDMVYRLNFMITSKRRDRKHTLELTGFIDEIPDESLEMFGRLVETHRQGIIFVTATGFSTPLADYINRKLLVKGFKCIQTNAYGVYDSNQIGGSLVIAISKSGETDAIAKVIRYAVKNQMDVISFTGPQDNFIARSSTVNIPVPDDHALDDRNVTANYFYARVMILFEYLMSRLMEERRTDG
mgnify:CR=1 FL=1